MNIIRHTHIIRMEEGIGDRLFRESSRLYYIVTVYTYDTQGWIGILLSGNPGFVWAFYIFNFFRVKSQLKIGLWVSSIFISRVEKYDRFASES